MRFVTITCLTATFLVLGSSACKDADSHFVAPAPKITEPVVWIDGVKSLEDYEKEHPDRKIFAFFTADFNLMGVAVEKEIELHQQDLFPKVGDFLFVRFDLSQRNPLANEEMHRIGTPLTPLIVTNASGQWEHAPKKGGTVGEILAEIRALTAEN